jgi:acetyl-CoA/propionyl-CoA carboxylase biotin carboxyl carrier protein
VPPPPDDVVVAAALALLPDERDEPVTSVFDLRGGWRVGADAWTVVALVAERRTATVRVRGSGPHTEVSLDDADATPAQVSRTGDHLAVTWNGRRRVYVAAAETAAVWVGRGGDAWRFRDDTARRMGTTAPQGGGPVAAPMPGVVTDVRVREGEAVAAGQTMLVMEAMKMHHRITAPTDGVVRALSVGAGDQVEIDRTLLVIDPDIDADR